MTFTPPSKKRYSYVAGKFTRVAGRKKPKGRPVYIDRKSLSPQERGQLVLKEIYDREVANRTIISDIRKGADLTQRDKNGATILMRAITRGKEEVFDFLLKQGVALDDRNKLGETALIMAANCSQKIMVTRLLESGVHPDQCDDRKVTALMSAVFRGNHSIAEILLKHKANMDAADVESNTALSLAIIRGHAKISQLLIESGASLSGKTAEGLSMASLARQHGQDALARQIESAIIDQVSAAARQGLPTKQPLKPGKAQIKPKKPQ